MGSYPFVFHKTLNSRPQNSKHAVKIISAISSRATWVSVRFRPQRIRRNPLQDLRQGLRDTKGSGGETARHRRTRGKAPREDRTRPHLEGGGGPDAAIRKRGAEDDKAVRVGASSSVQEVRIQRWQMFGLRKIERSNVIPVFF